MKFQAKNVRHRKGEPRRDVREHVGKAILDAENLDEAEVLAKLFNVFMDVGTGGLNLMLDRTLAAIEEIRAKEEEQCS